VFGFMHRHAAIGFTEAIPVVRLTEAFRQAAASRVILGAHRINQGHAGPRTAC